VVLRPRSLSKGPFSFESSSVSQQIIQPLVDEVVGAMQSLTDPTLLSGGDASFDHVVSQPIQPVV
jgi:hypothetical protein